MDSSSLVMDTVLSSRYVRYIQTGGQASKDRGTGSIRQGDRVVLELRCPGVGNFILLLLKDKTCLSQSLLSNGAVLKQKSTNCLEPTGSYLITNRCRSQRETLASSSRGLCSSTCFSPAFQSVLLWQRLPLSERSSCPNTLDGSF